MPLTDLDAKAHNAIPNVFQKQYEMVEKFKTFNAYGLFRRYDVLNTNYLHNVPHHVYAILLYFT